MRSKHSYIGTEHLLIALLRDDALASKVLNNLAVTLDSVRPAIEKMLGHNERIIIAHIIPTSRVKKVIELSFEAARLMSVEYVGTEHLLLGLLREGEGIAAHVLRDAGVTAESAKAEINRLLAEAKPDDPPEPKPRRPRKKPKA